MASVGPRPIVTRLLVPASASTRSLQSSSAAAASRSGRRSIAPSRSASPVQRRGQAQQHGERGHERLARRNAQLRPGAHRQDDVARRHERAVGGIDDRHGQRARGLGASCQLDEIVAPPRLRDGEEQLVLEAQPPAVDAGDVGRRLGDGNADVALDQVLAEGRRMRRAAACAGDDDLRRPPLEPADELRQGLRQVVLLAPDGLGGFADLARHLRVGDLVLLGHDTVDLAYQLASAVGLGLRTREPQCPGECIGRRWNQAAPRLAAEPRREARCQPARQRQPRHAERAEPRGQRIDMPRRKPHQLASGRIVLARVLDDERRQTRKVARACRAHPAHDGMGVGPELLEGRAQQARPGCAPVVRPQHPAHDLAAEPRAAALVGNRKPPAADAIVPSAKHRPCRPCRCRR